MLKTEWERKQGPSNVALRTFGCQTKLVYVYNTYDLVRISCNDGAGSDETFVPSFKIASLPFWSSGSPNTHVHIYIYQRRNGDEDAFWQMAIYFQSLLFHEVKQVSISARFMPCKNEEANDHISSAWLGWPREIVPWRHWKREHLHIVFSGFFEQRLRQVGSWVPKCVASPLPTRSYHHLSRCAIENRKASESLLSVCTDLHTFWMLSLVGQMKARC